MGGDVTVASEPGSGSIFTFLLPDRDADLASTRLVGRSTRFQPTRSLHALRFLLIADERENCLQREHARSRRQIALDPLACDGVQESRRRRSRARSRSPAVPARNSSSRLMLVLCPDGGPRDSGRGSGWTSSVGRALRADDVDVEAAVAVGTLITERPPHRSVRAAFPHTAPTSVQTASACRMRSSACDTLIRFWPGTCFAGPHSPWSPPLAPPAPQRTLRIVRRLHGYYGEVRLSRSCIIGYGSSPSRCGPGRHMAGGSRDSQVPTRSFARDVALDPGGTTMPRMTALLMLRLTMKSISAPASRSFRGSLPRPTHPLCTLRVRRYRRLTQHSLPGGLLGLTWAGLAPADRASFAWRLPLFDHLVSAQHQSGWNVVTDCPARP